MAAGEYLVTTIEPDFVAGYSGEPPEPPDTQIRSLEDMEELTGAMVDLSLALSVDHFLDYRRYRQPLDEPTDLAVAKAGRKYFEQLVPQEQRELFLEKLDINAEGKIPEVRGLVILGGEALRVPWNLLYFKDVNEEGEVDRSGFLGFHKVFLYQPDGLKIPIQDDKLLRRRVSTAKYISVGHVLDDQFFTARTGALSWAMTSYNFSIVQAPAIPLISSAVLLDDFVMTPRDFVHFDCHEINESATAAARRPVTFRVRNGYPVKPAQYKKWEHNIGTNVTAVLNVCNAAHSYFTRRTGKGREVSVAETLVRNGMRAAIGPISPVPVTLCMELSTQFYRSIENGMTLIDAFDQSQRAMMSKRQFSITSLSFVLFGDFDHVVQPVVGTSVVPFPAKTNRSDNK